MLAFLASITIINTAINDTSITKTYNKTELMKKGFKEKNTNEIAKQSNKILDKKHGKNKDLQEKKQFQRQITNTLLLFPQLW